MPPNVLVSARTFSTNGGDSISKSGDDVSPHSTFSTSPTAAEQGGSGGASDQLQEKAKPIHLWFARHKRRFIEPLSEFWGVFVLILFGNG